MGKIKSVKERFLNWKMPIISHGKTNEYGWTVFYPQNLKLGKYTDIGYGTLINAEMGIEIGEGTQIGPYCVILTKNTINGTQGSIRIGSSARIGAYSLILPNTIIEDGRLLRAYSIAKEGR